MAAKNKYVTVDKETAAGVPVFKGTRVAVKTLFDYLEESSLEEFLEGFPSVTREQAEAMIDHAERTKALILRDLRDSVNEVNLIKAEKLKGIPARDIIGEL